MFPSLSLLHLKYQDTSISNNKDAKNGYRNVLSCVGDLVSLLCFGAFSTFKLLYIACSSSPLDRNRVARAGDFP